MQPRCCHRADSFCFKIKAHLLIHAHVSDPVICANSYTCVWMDFSTGWFLNFDSNAPSSQLNLHRQWTSTSSTQPVGFQGSASCSPHINIYVHKISSGRSNILEQTQKLQQVLKPRKYNSKGLGVYIIILSAVIPCVFYMS